jgi:hypothetical protein
MKIQIEKDLEDLVGWNLLFEDKDGDILEDKLEEVRKDLVKFEVQGWFKTTDVKVVDILN